jgi:hypothetical protein
VEVGSRMGGLKILYVWPVLGWVRSFLSRGIDFLTDQVNQIIYFLKFCKVVAPGLFELFLCLKENFKEIDFLFEVVNLFLWFSTFIFFNICIVVNHSKLILCLFSNFINNTSIF